MSHAAQVESTPTPAARTFPIGPANPGRPVIEVNGLRVTYPGSTMPAVDGVSFDVAAGEIFGFLGPNGAGKSTTQRVLTRQLRTFGGPCGSWTATFGSGMRPSSSTLAWASNCPPGTHA